MAAHSSTDGYLEMVKKQLTQEELEEEPGEDIDLDQDVYGATMFSVVYDLSELLTGIDLDGFGLWMNMTRLIFVLVVLMANFTLQIGMLYWIYLFVVAPSVHTAQNLYRMYHVECFIDGEFSKAKFDEWDYKPDLCGLGYNNFGFMYAIVCLWWTVMLNEFRKNEQLMMNVSGIPHTSDPREMVSVGDDGVVRFKSFTPLVRWTLYIVLVIPKICICAILSLIGTTWLVATDSYGDLILNAIALEFVIQVDELLFQAMLPSFICARIDNTKFWKAGKKNSAEEKKKVFVQGYRRSFIYLSSLLIFVYILLTYGQSLPIVGVFPGYGYDVQCDDFFVEVTRRVCEWGDDCFAKG